MSARSAWLFSAWLCLSACTGKTTGDSTVPSTAGGHDSAAGAGSNAGGQLAPKPAGRGAAGNTSAIPDAHVPIDMPADARVGDAGARRDAGDIEDAGANDASRRDAAEPSDAAADSGMPMRTLACPSAQSYGSPLPTQRAATLVKTGFGFIEGPVWVAKLGELLFSDMDMSTAQNANGPSSQIHRFKPPSAFDVLVASSGSNGLALDNDGRVIAATHDIQSLSYFDPVSGARESRSLTYQGKHFNSPNDVAVRSDGNVYFTDPDWQIGPRKSETGMLGAYRVSPSGEVTLVDGSLDEPNGIAITPDEKTLYVGQRGDNVMAYPLDADGKTGSGKAFANSGMSDGMTIDCAGNLYVALAVTRATSPIGAVGVFSSSGQKLGEITLDQQSTNVAFGGPEQKTLFITAGPSLYSIELNIPGRAY